MKRDRDAAWDELILRHLDEEAFTMNPKLENALKRAIYAPQARREAGRISRRGLVIALALTVIGCAVVLALSVAPPSPDISNGYEDRAAAGQPMVTAAPVITVAPDATVSPDATASPDSMLVDIRAAVAPPEIIVLSPGESVTAQAIYYLSLPPDDAKLGELLELPNGLYGEETLEVPGSVGYAAQQARFMQAYEESKMIVAGGRLVLPDGVEIKLRLNSNAPSPVLRWEAELTPAVILNPKKP